MALFIIKITGILTEPDDLKYFLKKQADRITGSRWVLKDHRLFFGRNLRISRNCRSAWRSV